MTQYHNTTANPTVSIGMPVYNGTKYIRQAIDSLLTQTFNDFELIISDNASTDSTESICQEYVKKDSRIRYFRQSENMGGHWNIRFVFEKAKGTYFMWAAAAVTAGIMRWVMLSGGLMWISQFVSLVMVSIVVVLAASMAAPMTRTQIISRLSNFRSSLLEGA